MALEYVLTDHKTGAILLRNLPVTRGTDKNERNVIDGGTSEIEVETKGLADSFLANWKTNLAPISRGVALIDNEKPITDPNAVLSYGFINKANAPVGRGFIRLQVATPNEWLAATPAVRLWGGKLDKDYKASYSSTSWGNLLAVLVGTAFGLYGPTAPAGAPMPPSIIRNGLNVPTEGTFSKEDVPTDSKSVLSMMEEIRDEDSGSGIEWQFRPVFDGPDFIKYDFVTGTDSVPHINRDKTVAIELSENSSQQITAFDTTIDSRESFNKVYIKYTEPSEDDTGETFVRAFWDNSDPTKPVVGKYITAPAPLTDAQVEALAAAYLEDGRSGGQELSFTVAGEWDKSEWLSNLGATITFTGLPSTLSAGHSATVRCIGITFSVQKSTIEVTFMPLQTVYPQTPKSTKKQNAFKPAIKQVDSQLRRILDSSGKTPIYTAPVPPEGGTTTPPPSTEWSNDGVFNNADKWGSEGRNPDDTTIKRINSPTWDELKSSGYDFPGLAGKWAIHPLTMVQDKGNRIYGLSHSNDGFASKFPSNPNVEPTHYRGGIDRATGMPIQGYAPVHIRKTSLRPDGTMGPLETIDTIPVELLNSWVAEWEDQSYEVDSYYMTGFYFSNWIGGDDRYYFCATHMYDHGAGPYTNIYNDINPRYITNAQKFIVSKAINLSTGKLEGDWMSGGITPIKWTAPITLTTARYGTVSVFGESRAVCEAKLKNMNKTDLDKFLNDNAPDNHLADYLWYPRGEGQNMYASYSRPPAPLEGVISLSHTELGQWPFRNNYDYMATVGISQYFDHGTAGNCKPFRTEFNHNMPAPIRVYNGKLFTAQKKTVIEPKQIHESPQWVQTSEAGNYPDTQYGCAVARGWIMFPGSEPKQNALAIQVNDNTAGVTNEQEAKANTTLFADFPFVYFEHYTTQQGGQAYDFDAVFGFATETSKNQQGFYASPIFSYDGRLYQFALGGPKRIILRSIRMKEAPTT